MEIRIASHFITEKGLTLKEAFVLGYIQVKINQQTPMRVVLKKEDVLKDLECVIKGHDTFYRMYSKFQKLGLIHIMYFQGNYIFQIYPFEVDSKINNKKVNKAVYVYLMIDEYTGLHKIGKSSNVSFREKTLLSQTPKIKLVHFFRRPDVLEKDLHKKYAHKRIRGEWFELSNEDVEYIKSL